MQIIFLILKLNTASSRILFFPSVNIKGNKLDTEIQNASGLKYFLKNILRFIRPAVNNIFSCQNLKSYDLRLVTFMNVNAKITSKTH